MSAALVLRREGPSCRFCPRSSNVLSPRMNVNNRPSADSAGDVAESAKCVICVYSRCPDAWGSLGRGCSQAFRTTARIEAATAAPTRPRCKVEKLRAARVRSACTSAADAYRLSRSFASNLRMMRLSTRGTLGLTVRGDGGSSARTALTTDAADAPANAGRPATISYRTAPSEKRSVRASTRSPLACSGDM